VTRIITFIVFDLPSMLLIFIHKFYVANIRGEFWKPWNIWFYRIGGLLLWGVALLVVSVFVALSGGGQSRLAAPPNSSSYQNPTDDSIPLVDPPADSLTDTPATTEAPTAQVGDLVAQPNMVVGQCFDFTNRKAVLHSLTLADCDSPHSGEVMALADSALYAYPVSQSDQDAAARDCSQGAMQNTYPDGHLGIWIAITSSEANWYRGEKTVACIYGRRPTGSRTDSADNGASVSSVSDP
jgi:putative regulator of septum formation